MTTQSYSDGNVRLSMNSTPKLLVFGCSRRPKATNQLKCASLRESTWKSTLQSKRSILQLQAKEDSSQKQAPPERKSSPIKDTLLLKAKASWFRNWILGGTWSRRWAGI